MFFLLQSLSSWHPSWGSLPPSCPPGPSWSLWTSESSGDPAPSHTSCPSSAREVKIVTREVSQHQIICQFKERCGSRVCVSVPACCVVVVTIPCCSLYACSCRYLRVSWFLSRYCSIWQHNNEGCSNLKITFSKFIFQVTSQSILTHNEILKRKTGQSPLARRPLSSQGLPSVPEQRPWWERAWNELCSSWLKEKIRLKVNWHDVFVKTSMKSGQTSQQHHRWFYTHFSKAAATSCSPWGLMLFLSHTIVLQTHKRHTPLNTWFE